MRVLLVNKRAPFEGRGAEHVIWEIGKRFADAGHRIRFFCPTPSSKSEIPEISGVEFEFVETSSEPTRGMIEFFLRGARQYRGAYREFEPDVVYDNPSPFPFHAAHVVGDVPVINKVHAVYRSYAFSCKDHPFVKAGTILGEESYRLFRGEHFVTNSVSTATRLRDLVNTAKNELVANPIGINTEDFTYSVPEQSKHVLTVSKLSPRKRIGDLLRAWSDVEDEHPDATLKIAGSGPLESDLHSLRDRLDLHTVTFEGFVSETRKHELLQDAGVFAAPTLYEGFGLSILEAMASGCAVVTTDTWGVRDFVDHEENGLNTPSKSSERFATELARVLSNPGERKRYAEAGRQTAESYSMTESLDRELDHLQSVANERKLESST
jgi:glycosyltransferase involved in cell wall biosynthesis